MTSIEITLETLCQCELDEENLFNISLSCEPNSGLLTFAMSVAFANEDGSLLASSFTSEAEQWIVKKRTINGRNFTISTAPAEKPATTPTDIVLTTEVRTEEISHPHYLLHGGMV